MKKLIFGALATVALVSCSSEEVIEMNRVNDEITFGVVTNKPTKAFDVYCNNNMPEEFVVYATHDGKTYIDGDQIEKDGTAWKNLSGTRYWPNTGDVKFFAHVNAGGNFSWNTTCPTINDYEVDTDVANQMDLMYAVKSQGKSDNPVMMNFRHALSQIVFSAKNTNPNLYVEVSGVKVCNVGNKNSFTYTTDDTDNNIVDHTENIGTITETSWGTWADMTAGTTTYPVTFAPVSIIGDNSVVSLTSANEIGKEYNNNAMLLLPQKTTQWDVTTAPNPDDAVGSYFLVNCLIYNVANGTIDKNSDICLWGTENGGTYEPKELAIPVDFNWEQGKKYIYTFVFGNGNGGYDPDPSDPSKPDPVLVPINFEISVDDFVVVSNTEIESGI